MKTYGGGVGKQQALSIIVAHRCTRWLGPTIYYYTTIIISQSVVTYNKPSPSRLDGIWPSVFLFFLQLFYLGSPRRLDKTRKSKMNADLKERERENKKKTARQENRINKQGQQHLNSWRRMKNNTHTHTHTSAAFEECKKLCKEEKEQQQHTSTEKMFQQRTKGWNDRMEIVKRLKNKNIKKQMERWWWWRRRRWQ